MFVMAWMLSIPGYPLFAADPLQIDHAAGPVQANTACLEQTAIICDLRVYQVMVEAFVDGDPDHNYNAGYGNSHHKGDLRGIIKSLDHIRDLGMSAIWLTPIFDSHAGQPQKRLDGSAPVDLKLDATGYFTRDYFSIDPKFGTLDDARELVNAAHERGLYVFLDGVFGHHKGDLVASPTGKLPVDSTNPADYDNNPSGYPGRVVDYGSPATVEFYKEVATWWINELGIDGWRLDQAYQVPPGAWREIRAAVEAVSASRRQSGHRWGVLGYMVAEIFSGADDIAEQALGSDENPTLNSAFDFPLRYATVGVLAAEESGLSGRPASTLNENWAYGAHSTIYPEHAMLNMMLGNHDLVRYGDLLQRASIADPQDSEWWARHRLAFMVQTAYSGPVTRYYGEEIGDEVPGFSQKVNGDCASQGLCDDHVARSSAKIPGVTQPAEEFSAEQHALLQFHQELMSQRVIYRALSHGSRQHLFSDNTAYVDLKTHGSQEVVFAMNSGAQTRELRLNLELFKSSPAQGWDVLNATPVSIENGYLEISLAPLTGRIILLDEQPIDARPINAGMTDAWYNPATDGQGFLIVVYPKLELVFLSWFTYDVERPDPSTPSMLGEPGHRWLTAQGGITGNRARLQVFVTQGGIFDSGLPAPTTDPVGWMELEFDGCKSVRLLYQIDTPELSGEIDLQRITLDNAALCEALSGE